VKYRKLFFSAIMSLAWQHHGKGRVRLGRVWREGSTHHFVEWQVQSMLESDMLHAYTSASNEGMVATDTQKNTVYYMAKQCSQKCTAEEYAIALGKHFVSTYPEVTKAKIWVDQKPWQRVSIGGKAHDHGYSLAGTETRTTYVTVSEDGKTEIISGVKDWKVLKTTQSGYEGFKHDKYTLLPDTKERMVATSITSTWKYGGFVADYDAAYEGVKAGIMQAFYGPPKGGVFSPSVQFTLMEMGKAVLAKVSAVESIFFNLPNIHFLPCTPVTSKFENDVYIATSEPHGNIEAVVTRKDAQPHSKL
jgi:urate oxidase